MGYVHFPTVAVEGTPIPSSPFLSFIFGWNNQMLHASVQHILITPDPSDPTRFKATVAIEVEALRKEVFVVDLDDGIEASAIRNTIASASHMLLGRIQGHHAVLSELREKNHVNQPSLAPMFNVCIDDS